MSKLYTPEPMIGSLGLSMKGKSRAEKEKFRVETIANIHPDKLKKFVINGVQIIVKSGPILVGNSVHFHIESARTLNGTEIPIDKTGYIIVNPPLKAPNGTWRLETIKLPSGEVLSEIDIENDEENPEKAIKLAILKGIQYYAGGEGVEI